MIRSGSAGGQLRPRNSGADRPGLAAAIAGENQVRLTLRGALIGVWRQAWPLTSLYLRAADRRSRQLLAGQAIDADDFTGGALSIVVDRQPLPVEAGVIMTIGAGYEYVRPLALQTDPRCGAGSGGRGTGPRRRGSNGARASSAILFVVAAAQPERRIRRLHGFDIVLDPGTATVLVTAMDREFEQAATRPNGRS